MDKQDTRSCWIDTSAMVLSFHAIAEYEQKRFESRQEMLEFAKQAVFSGYRIR